MGIVDARFEIFLDAGIADQKTLEEADQQNGGRGFTLGKALVDMGQITEENFAVKLATHLKTPFINLDMYNFEDETLKLIPAAMAIKYRCLPLEKIGQTVSFAISGPEAYTSLKDNEDFLNCRVQCFVTTISALDKKINEIYGA